MRKKSGIEILRIAKSLQYIPDDSSKESTYNTLIEIIYERIKKEGIETSSEYFKAISYIPSEKSALLWDILQKTIEEDKRKLSDNKKVLLITKMLYDQHKELPNGFEKHQISIINSIINQYPKESYKYYINTISYAPENEKEKLYNHLNDTIKTYIKNKLESNKSTNEKTLALEHMQYITGPKEEIIDIIKKTINILLEKDDIEKQIAGAEMVVFLPEEKKIDIQKKIKEIIDTNYPNDIKIDIDSEGNVSKVIKLIRYMTKEDKTDILKKINGKTLIIPDEIDKHKLYQYKGQYQKSLEQKVNIDNHEHHSNTGAIILTKNHQGKAYERIIGISSFLRRKKAYEAYDIRSKNGRDYVPIEPILSFKATTDEKVKVTSKLLHTDILEFCKTRESILFMDEIESKTQQIRDGLKKIGVSHGDIAYRNFCVQFYYDQKGKIDITRCPRIYLIDRDK